ncbi:hypothetical protein ACFFLS_16345 [Flavobacterium procerum]|uniref:Sugar-binding protein n=1 Tax=Flavobacterium procerum TaxID=1455569 RepID=A0ABV6BT48_9FLAO
MLNKIIKNFIYILVFGISFSYSQTKKIKKEIITASSIETNKILYTVSINYNKNQKVTKKVETGVNFSWETTTKTFFYDNKNNLIKECFYSNNTKAKLDFKDSTRYFYDNGKTVKRIKYNQGFIKTPEIMNYHYNKDGLLAKQFISNNEYYVYKYPKNDTVSIVTKNYDNQVCYDLVTLSLKKGDTITQRIFNKYSRQCGFNSNSKRESIYDGEGKLKVEINEIGYYYYENGLISKVCGEEKKYCYNYFEYKFDANNNWIERKEFKNNSPAILSKRELEYYD